MTDIIYKNTARLFSFIFNPFIIPTLGFLIVFFSLPTTALYSAQMKNILLGIIFVTSFVIPIAFILLLSAISNFNSYMQHHRDRIFPYVFSAFSVFMGARLLAKLPVPQIFSLYMTAASITLIILFIITMRWKISGHASGMGGLLGLLFAITFKYGLDLTGFIIIAILVSGIVGTSRIYLQKHTSAQVYAGLLVSFTIMFLTINFF